jgi:hypothetical protein
LFLVLDFVLIFGDFWPLVGRGSMPKTYKDLYGDICAFSNLYLAHRKARRGGKRRQPKVAEFEHNLGENLLDLQEELWEQTYRPGAYRSFIVIERKERKISAAPYRDRVVHHALMNVVGPIWEARLIHECSQPRLSPLNAPGLSTLAAPVSGAVCALARHECSVGQVVRPRDEGLSDGIRCMPLR